jgi:hypothetical protein
MEDDVPVEAMDIKWNSMNIKSVLEREQTKELTSLYLLQDLSTAIEIQRLLDVKYNNQVNEMKIGILMGAMDFLLSEKQFALIMGILNENLKEGAATTAPKKAAQPQAAAPKKEEQSAIADAPQQDAPTEVGKVTFILNFFSYQRSPKWTFLSNSKKFACHFSKATENSPTSPTGTPKHPTPNLSQHLRSYRHLPNRVYQHWIRAVSRWLYGGPSRSPSYHSYRLSKRLQVSIQANPSSQCYRRGHWIADPSQLLDASQDRSSHRSRIA